MLDLSRVPQDYIDVVQNAIDHDRHSPKKLAELEPEKFVELWLNWQSQFGSLSKRFLASQTIELMKYLEWRPTWKK